MSGGWSEGIWPQAKAQIVSDERAVSPAHPWHVCGTEGAQGVGQLVCIAGRLALPPPSLPLPFAIRLLWVMAAKPLC